MGTADEAWHGTHGGYTNHKCRCDKCRKANADWQYNKRLERMVDGLPAGDSRHGTDNGYANYGCRCRPCTDAHTITRQRGRARAVAVKDRSEG